MKKYIFLIGALLISAGLYAQQKAPVSDLSTQTVVNKFAKKYNLDNEQKDKMTKIQERRLRNLSEIINLESSNPGKFIQKKEAINSGTEVSIKMMLNKEQRALYDKDRIAIRLKKAEKTKELKKQGMTPEEMKPYLIAIDDEQY
ncbi:MAG: hypothetical protein AB8F74_21500 [Saprospiraceae bacterium]